MIGLEKKYKTPIYHPEIRDQIRLEKAWLSKTVEFFEKFQTALDPILVLSPHSDTIESNPSIHLCHHSATSVYDMFNFGIFFTKFWQNFDVYVAPI